MAMAWLRGKTLDIWWTSIDHTYVESSGRNGPWSCPWPARDSGGRTIAEGYGDETVAQCLSEPFEGASIVYGAEGICHQMSNRILIPAGVVVSAAPGYGFSNFIWGTYGEVYLEETNMFHYWLNTRGRWCGLVWRSPVLRTKEVGKQRKHMERVNALYDEAASKIIEAASRDNRIKKDVERANTLYDEAKSEALEIGTRDARFRKHMKRANTLYNETISKALETVPRGAKVREVNEELVAEDVKLMIEHRLGAGFDRNKIKGLLDMRTEFGKERRKMHEAFSSRGRSGKQAAEEVNEQFSKLLKRIEKELGPVEYEKLFGRPPEVSFTLIDPEIAGAEKQ